MFLENKVGKPFLRSEDVRDNYLDFSTIHYVSDDVHKILHKSHCRKNQVILTMAGAYLGRSAVFDKDFECSSNQATAKITLKDDKVLPYFLSTFLNCYYGQFQINRYRTLTGQPNINLGQIQTLRVPILSNAFQLEIERLVKSAHAKLEESKALYAEAEKMLLDELGLSNWQPSPENVAVKSLKESFFETGRLDAEFYQPKYDELMQVIRANKFVELGNLVVEHSTGYPFDSKSYIETGYDLIRINNIKKGLLDLSSSAKIPNDDILLSPKDIVKENDLVLSMSGTIGNCCKVPKDVKGIINQRILRFSIKDVDVDTLVLLINSIVGTMQLERVGTGGVQTNISSSDIFKIEIPIIPKSLQDTVCNQVTKSFELQAESKQLLELAKQAVEVAIEQDEDAALAMIKE